MRLAALFLAQLFFSLHHQQQQQQQCLPQALPSSEASSLTLSSEAEHTLANTAATASLPSSSMSAHKLRTVVRTLLSVEQSEGVGARVRRSIGRREMPSLDPFLMLDEFRGDPSGGFPDHPHRGQETVSFLLKGVFDHEDSMGHKGRLEAGDLQWMTAGRGILHAEMPVTNDVHGLQLWVNLPKAEKMCEPRYQELRDKDIPRAKLPGVEIKVICGDSFGISSPVRTKTPMMYLEFKMEPNSSVEQTVPADYNAFVYTLAGKANFGPSPGKEVEAHHTIALSDGDALRIETRDSPAHFVLIGGRPINEPVVQHGPFVMNTKEDIYRTMIDFQMGQNGFESARNWESEIGKRVIR